jgi:glycosyltransferase involved in cell wall biosynthesis
MMNQCEVTANNSVLDAQFYASNGHPRSIYLQNMWPDIDKSGDGLPRVEHRKDIVKIIGSIGNLGATGNTFGLYYLGKEVLPRLSKRLVGQDFEIHLLGKGAPSPVVAPYLSDERIKHRGWVDDINEEIFSSHAFLIMTNSNEDFLVGNTRLLLAWALGACVILHANSALAMPEIEHEKNALLGNTPDEIVDCIIRVAGDEKLRYQIGQGGYKTFMHYYRSDVVMPKMIGELENCVVSFGKWKQNNGNFEVG